MLIKGKLVKYFGFVFLASLAISIGLFPYLVFVFKEFNFLSMFFNVLLMPLAAIALILVFVTLLVSFSWLFLGQILGFFSAIAIDLFMWCLTFLGDFGLRGNVLMFNLNYMVLIYYLGLFVLVVDFYKKHKKLTLNL